MKIGVISDTHMRGASRALASLTQGVFADVDMILHCGDITRLDVLDAFAPAKVVAVAGNMDGPDVDRHLKDREVITAGGFTIGLIHGWGSRVGLEDRIFEVFSGVDAICYGHSHTPANHVRDGVLLFNPGSCSSGVADTLDGTVGILTLDSDITGTIVKL